METTNLQKAILACIILGYIERKDYSMLEIVCDEIDEDYFNTKNKIIFNAMMSLYKQGFPIDNITVSQECLGKIDQWEVSDLFVIENQIPTSSSLNWYLERLKKETLNFRIKNAKDSDEVEKILATKKRRSKIETISFDKAIDEAIIENKESNKDIIEYGYQFLDKRLGGMQKGELLLLGGITGTGKSTFSIKIALNASKKGKKVVIVSLEERIVQRARKEIYYYCNRMRKTRKEKSFRLVDYLNGKENFRTEEELEAKNKLSNNIQYIKSDSRVSINQIKDIFKLKADLYIFDHLHYFGIETKDESKANAIEQAMQEIKNLTVQNETRTILIAHFTKLDESRRPTMTAFKDSISIPQTADTVIMLWRDKSSEHELNTQYETEFICPKNRIDEPAFTSKVLFDITTNDYLGELDYRHGTKNSEHQEIQKSFNQKII